MNSHLRTLIEEDERFGYNGLGGQRSTCRVRLFNSEQTGQIVAVVTELPTNPGSSVTNSVENLATAITEQFEIEPERFLMVEHYPAEQHAGSTFDASYSRVNLKHDARHGFIKASPAWTPLDAEAVASLTGTPVEEWQGIQIEEEAEEVSA